MAPLAATRSLLLRGSTRGALERARLRRRLCRGQAQALTQGQRDARMQCAAPPCAASGAAPAASGLDWTKLGEGPCNLEILQRNALTAPTDKKAFVDIMRFQDTGSAETWSYLANETVADWDTLKDAWHSLADVAARSADSEHDPFRRLVWHLVELQFQDELLSAQLASGALPLE